MKPFHTKRPGVVLAASLLALLSILVRGHAEAPRPNIVLIIADDLTARYLPAYGGTDLKTPHIDRLASEGVLLTNGYTSTAMCAPTRAQLYTGLFPVRNGAYPNHSQIRPHVRTLPDYLKEVGYRVGLNGKRHFGPADQYPFENVGGGKFNEEAIREFVAKEDDSPFLLVFASSSPHVPWTAGDSSVYDPAKLRVPEGLLDTLETREALARYYGEVSDLDRETGLILEALEDAGKGDNTLVLFTTEQGAQFPGAKWTCFEDGLRVGIIARWPGFIEPGTVAHAWVHYVDIVPTLLEFAGAPAQDDLDGRSISAVLFGDATTHRQEIFGVHTQKGAIGAPENGYPVRSVRIGRYKYIWNLNHAVPFTNALTTADKEGYWDSWVQAAEGGGAPKTWLARYISRPEEELYDLEADPLETKNLIEQATLKPERDRLRARLLGWMEEQGDAGMAAELDAGSRQKRPR